MEADSLKQEQQNVTESPPILQLQLEGQDEGGKNEVLQVVWNAPVPDSVVAQVAELAKSGRGVEYDGSNGDDNLNLDDAHVTDEQGDGVADVNINEQEVVQVNQQVFDEVQKPNVQEQDQPQVDDCQRVDDQKQDKLGATEDVQQDTTSPVLNQDVVEQLGPAEQNQVNEERIDVKERDTDQNLVGLGVRDFDNEQLEGDQVLQPSALAVPDDSGIENHQEASQQEKSDAKFRKEDLLDENQRVAYVQGNGNAGTQVASGINNPPLDVIVQNYNVDKKAQNLNQVQDLGDKNEAQGVKDDGDDKDVAQKVDEEQELQRISQPIDDYEAELQQQVKAEAAVVTDQNQLIEQQKQQQLESVHNLTTNKAQIIINDIGNKFKALSDQKQQQHKVDIVQQQQFKEQQKGADNLQQQAEQNENVKRIEENGGISQQAQQQNTTLDTTNCNSITEPLESTRGTKYHQVLNYHNSDEGRKSRFKQWQYLSGSNFDAKISYDQFQSFILKQMTKVELQIPMILVVETAFKKANNQKINEEPQLLPYENYQMLLFYVCAYLRLFEQITVTAVSQAEFNTKVVAFLNTFGAGIVEYKRDFLSLCGSQDSVRLAAVLNYVFQQDLMLEFEEMQRKMATDQTQSSQKIEAGFFYEQLRKDAQIFSPENSNVNVDQLFRRVGNHQQLIQFDDLQNFVERQLQIRHFGEIDQSQLTLAFEHAFFYAEASAGTVGQLARSQFIIFCQYFSFFVSIFLLLRNEKLTKPEQIANIIAMIVKNGGGMDLIQKVKDCTIFDEILDVLKSNGFEIAKTANGSNLVEDFFVYPNQEYQQLYIFGSTSQDVEARKQLFGYLNKRPNGTGIDGFIQYLSQLFPLVPQQLLLRIGAEWVFKNGSVIMVQLLKSVCFHFYCYLSIYSQINQNDFSQQLVLDIIRVVQQHLIERMPLSNNIQQLLNAVSEVNQFTDNMEHVVKILVLINLTFQNYLTIGLGTSPSPEVPLSQKLRPTIVPQVKQNPIIQHQELQEAKKQQFLSAHDKAKMYVPVNAFPGNKQVKYQREQPSLPQIYNAPKPKYDPKATKVETKEYQYAHDKFPMPIRKYGVSSSLDKHLAAQKFDDKRREQIPAVAKVQVEAKPHKQPPQILDKIQELKLNKEQDLKRKLDQERILMRKQQELKQAEQDLLNQKKWKEEQDSLRIEKQRLMRADQLQRQQNLRNHQQQVIHKVSNVAVPPQIVDSSIQQLAERHLAGNPKPRDAIQVEQINQLEVQVQAFVQQNKLPKIAEDSPTQKCNVFTNASLHQMRHGASKISSLSTQTAARLKVSVLTFDQAVPVINPVLVSADRFLVYFNHTD